MSLTSLSPAEALLSEPRNMMEPQTSPEATLDLQAFAPGVYLLQAQTAGGVLTAKVQVR